jgi:hypothetical protein
MLLIHKLKSRVKEIRVIRTIRYNSCKTVSKRKYQKMKNWAIRLL